MTRGEAIATYKKIYKSSANADDAIDVLVALGVLKVEQEKTPDEKAMEIINRNLDASNSVYHLKNVTGLDILLWLKKGGIQVVEAK